tara:strand:- start:902 stop:2419 length:1518 start_codon:yes stop_codon:yes gene_type:complete
MAITLQVPSSFACPNDDIFSLPTREDLVNAINDIAKIPGELKAEAVKLGDELSVEAQEEIDKIVEDIEKFMDKIADILSPYWKKGQTRNWQKEAKDAITEFIQEFHIYVPTKVAELISKIIPVSLKLSLFGLTIDCLRLFDPAYQKELQDQISGITKEHLAELEKIKEDLKKDVITQEEFEKKLKELNEKKSKIVDKFFAFIPEKIRGFNAEFGVKCDEWKAKMTWQYIKTKIQEFLTNGLHAVFGKLIDKFDEIWDALGLPSLISLFTVDIPTLIDNAIKSFKEKRDKLVEDLKDPELEQKARDKILEEIDGVNKQITDALNEFSIFGFDIAKIIGGKVDETVTSIEDKIVEIKIAFEDFKQNWQKKLMFDWVKLVKKFFSAIGLGSIFKPIFFTLCDLLKLIGFPPSIPKIGAIAGLTSIVQTEPKVNTYVPDRGDDSGVNFKNGDSETTTFDIPVASGDTKVFKDGVELEIGTDYTVSGGVNPKVIFSTAPLLTESVSILKI